MASLDASGLFSLKACSQDLLPGAATRLSGRGSSSKLTQVTAGRFSLARDMSPLSYGSPVHMGSS